MRTGAQLSAMALACALTLAGCGGLSSQDASSGDGATGSERTSTTGPGRATTQPGTEIPDDFPLAGGMGGPQDTIATSRTGTGLRDLEVCGTAPLRGLGVRDRMVADNSGGESADTRELVLLGSPEEAALVARAFADLAAGCDAPADGGAMETLAEVRDSPFGPAPATTLVLTYAIDGAPGAGATVIHVVAVGAALLVTSTYGHWTPETLEGGVAETVEPLRPTVAAMGLYGDGSAAGGDTGPGTEHPTSASVSADVPTVPDDFPLAVGLPEDGGDLDVTAPSAEADGMGEVEMCGEVVWPLGGTAGGTRRLVTGAYGPEYFEGRELVVHADAELAGDAMAAIRRAARECRRVDHQVWTVLERDTGHDTVTMGLTYADGLGSSVYQVTRVGAARLMVNTYGEGSLASLDEQADEVTGTTGTILPAMCVFTRTGC